MSKKYVLAGAVCLALGMVAGCAQDELNPIATQYRSTQPAQAINIKTRPTLAHTNQIMTAHRVQAENAVQSSANQQSTESTVPTSVNSQLNTAMAAATQAASFKPEAKLVALKNTHRMYVIQAKQGDITVNNRGQYTLTFNQKALSDILTYGERPNRNVKHIRGSTFLKMWALGKDGYAVDPPNAVLLADKLPANIVVLTGLTVEQGKVSLPLIGGHRLKAGTYNKITLAIDG